MVFLQSRPVMSGTSWPVGTLLFGDGSGRRRKILSDQNAQENLAGLDSLPRPGKLDEDQQLQRIMVGRRFQGTAGDHHSRNRQRSVLRDHLEFCQFINVRLVGG